MRTCPKWTVARDAGANHRIMSPQYRHTLANSFASPVTGEVSGAVHYVDQPVRN
jgi:hypothetical protein